MNYQVTLNNGQQVKLTGVTDFNTVTFTQTLNNREIQFVNIGGAIINKNIIISITPIEEQTTTEQTV